MHVAVVTRQRHCDDAATYVIVIAKGWAEPSSSFGRREHHQVTVVGRRSVGSLCSCRGVLHGQEPVLPVVDSQAEAIDIVRQRDERGKDPGEQSLLQPGESWGQRSVRHPIRSSAAGADNRGLGGAFVVWQGEGLGKSSALGC